MRFQVGDTDSRDWLLSDNEIVAVTDLQTNYWFAAAECAEHIAARLAREADTSISGPGAQNRALSQRAAAYERLAARLRRRASFAATPYAGGISIDDKDSEAADTDRPADAFTADQWTNENTS
jgi:hypothetical protein